MKKVVLVFLSTIIGACANIPLSAMVKMASLNPLEIVPKELVAVVEMPSGVNVQEGDIIVYFKFNTPDANVNFSHEFALQNNSNYPLPKSLQSDLNPTKTYRTFTLSSADAATMMQGQRIVKQFRMTSNEGGGFFHLSLNSACRTSGFNAELDKEINIHIKLEEQEDFFTLIDGADVTDLGKYNKNATANLAICDKFDSW